MEYKKLTKQQLEEAAKCTTDEERMAFLKENDIQLPDEVLSSISGGNSSDDWVCYDCGERFDSWWEYVLHSLTHAFSPF